jgi:hypothetical protein
MCPRRAAGINYQVHAQELKKIHIRSVYMCSVGELGLEKSEELFVQEIMRLVEDHHVE